MGKYTSGQMSQTQIKTLLLLLYHIGYHKASYYLIFNAEKFRINPQKSLSKGIYLKKPLWIHLEVTQLLSHKLIKILKILMRSRYSLVSQFILFQNVGTPRTNIHCAFLQINFFCSLLYLEYVHFRFYSVLLLQFFVLFCSFHFFPFFMKIY